MIQRPPGVGAFEFVVLAALRAAQLTRGCRPRIDGTHKAIMTAQFEVAAGKVTQLLASSPEAGASVVVGAVPGEPSALVAAGPLPAASG